MTEQSVLAYLQTHYSIHPSPQWLSETLASLQSDSQLNEQVLELWLKLDICQAQQKVEKGLKQRRFEDKCKWEEVDTVVVQLQKVKNIGMPIGEEGDEDEEEGGQKRIEKFENKYLEATEIGAGKRPGKWGGKEQNRIFKYLLSDGQNEIIAIEMEKLAYIHLDTT
jgi:hypothetical protein